MGILDVPMSHYPKAWPDSFTIYAVDIEVSSIVCLLGHSKLLALYWLPKLHNQPCTSRISANYSSCTTTNLSILLTSCLTAIKNHGIKYCTTVYETNDKNYFGPFNIQVRFLIKKTKELLESSLSTYDSLLSILRCLII